MGSAPYDKKGRHTYCIPSSSTKAEIVTVSLPFCSTVLFTDGTKVANIDITRPLWTTEYRHSMKRIGRGGGTDGETFRRAGRSRLARATQWPCQQQGGSRRAIGAQIASAPLVCACADRGDTSWHARADRHSVAGRARQRRSSRATASQPGGASGQRPADHQRSQPEHR